MKATAERTTAAGGARETVRAAQRIPGHPLAPATRVALEARFAHDLGDIRVHTDDLAAAAARALDAHAFAVGRDVFFARGAYRPGTAAGDALLEHEIAHALAAPRTPKPAPEPAARETPPASTPTDTVERNAEATVAALRAGRTPVVGAVRESDVRFARAAAGLMLRPTDAADPAQLVETLIQTVLRALRADAEDRNGRVRGELTRLDERTRRLVLDALHARLVAADWTHLIEVLTQPLPEATEQGTRPTDVPEAAATGETATADPAQATADPAQATADPAQATADPAQAAPAQATAGPGQAAADGVAGAGGAEATADSAADVERPPLQGGAAQASAAPGAASAGPVPAGGARAGEGAVAAPADTTVAEAVSADTAVTEAAPADAAGATAPAAEPGEATGASAGPTAAEAEPDGHEAEGMGSDGAAGGGVAVESEHAEEPAGPPEPATAAAAAPEPAAAEAAAPESAAAEPSAAESSASEPVPSAPSASEPVADVPAASGAVPQPAAAAAPPGATGGPMPAIDLGPEPAGGDDDAIGRLGGGGGGSALPDPPRRDEAPPAEAAPAATLATVAAGTPAAIARGLAAVRAAVGRVAARGRTALATAPPSMARPSGAPRGLAPQAPGAPAALPTAANLPGAPSGNAAAPSATAAAQAALAAGPLAAAPLPAVAAPAVTANAEGQVTAADAQRIAQSVDALPTTDPALQATAGDAPTVALEGDADPAQAQAQRAALARTAADATAAGAADAAVPLGEDGIAPTVAAETLHAEIPADAPAGAAAGGANAQLEGDDPAAIVAEARDGDTVRAATGAGAQALSAQDEQQTQSMATARDDAAQQSDAAVDESAQRQAVARDGARVEAHRQRGEWTTAQHAAVDGAHAQGDTEVSDAQQAVADHRTQGDSEARGRIGEGNQRIGAARTDAERQARTQRDRARNESSQGGFFSRLASAVTSFFNEIRSAIHAAFEAARRAVTEAVQWAQRAAAEAIARVRSAIVDRLRRAAERLGRLADVLLAAFPAARERFRNAIRRVVEAAVAAVDRFANALRAGIQRVLDLLGRALLAALAFAERAANQLVADVMAAVQGALRAAASFVATVGAFATLIRDIARNPGQWVRNLGASIVDGLKNHLWSALKTAVKEWFNGKVQQVVGVGKLVFDVLLRGGIPFRKIGAMVWSAVKAAIPRAIAEFLIQKLVAMLVPAAAAVMAIVEGLQAAWATVSRIIAAFERFVAFLRAVKDGNAGPQFAQALAAAAVAVIDFTANFIIAKIAKGAKGVGSRLKGIADKILAWLRRGAAAARRGLTRVRQAVVAAARWVGRQARRLGRWIANSGVGRFVGRQVTRVRGAVERFRARRAARRQATSAEKKARARAELVPIISGIANSGGSHRLLRLRYAWWRVRYGLSQLNEESSGGTSRVVMAASAKETLFSGLLSANDERIVRLTRVVATELLSRPSVRQARERLGAERDPSSGPRRQTGSERRPLIQSHGPGMIAEAQYMAEHTRTPWSTANVRVLGVPLQERQMFSRTPGGIYTKNPAGGSFTYEDITANAIALAGGRDDRAAARTFGALQSALHGTGRPPNRRVLSGESAKLIAPVVRVQTIEMARNRAQISRQVILSRLMREGQASIRQGMVEFNPMSRVGAVRQSNFMDADVLGFDPQQQYATVPSRPKLQGFAEAEVQAMQRYIALIVMTEEPTFVQESVLERFIRRHLQDYMEHEAVKYYHL